MNVDVLVLCPDGTQHMEHREVPDDFYSTSGLKAGEETGSQKNKPNT
jgi:hypothetical protein